MHFAYQMLSFTSPGSLFSVHVYARVRTSIYIYTKVSGSGEGLRTGIWSHFRASRASRAFGLLWSFRTAQNRPERAQSRSEPLRARPEPLRAAQSVRSELFEEPLWVAQSRSESPGAVAQGRPESLRIAQSAPGAARSRPERSLSAVRGTALGRPEPLRVAQSGRSASPRAAPSEEPLRIARSVPRAAQSRSELLEKRSGSSVSHALCISDTQFYFTWFPLLRACICTGSH